MKKPNGIAIDLDHNREDSVQARRGVTLWKHPATREYVYMYNDQPGKYLTEHGVEVSEDMAREAGADVERYAKARKKEQALAAAMAEIEAATNGPSGPGNTVLETKNGWSVVSIGVGNANVLDPDGVQLNAVPLSEAAAKILLSHMAA